MIPDNNMIQKMNSQYLPRLVNLICDKDIISAWRGIASRMVMDQYQTDRMTPDGLHIDLPRRDQRRVYSSFGQEPFCKKMILIIQHHTDHKLLLLMTELLHIVSRDGVQMMKAEGRLRRCRGNPF